MKRVIEKNNRRLRRKMHIRKSINGTLAVPRMTIFRSNKNVSVQIIDDENGKTLVSASMLEKDLINLQCNVKDAAQLGKVIGERAKAKNIDKIVFDRNGYKYHGVIQAVADGARKAGLQF